MRGARIAVWRAWATLFRPTRGGNLRRLRRRGETPESLRIREATAGDIEALARLHVRTWNATYAPFGERGPSAAIRARQWREKFRTRDPDWCCYVVERPDGTLVGFAEGGRSDHPDFDGELRKIHLLREVQRLGVGSRLIGRVARHLLSRGMRSMWLFGDARNPSVRAWRALGAEKCTPDPEDGSYGWRDISALARLPE